MAEAVAHAKLKRDLIALARAIPQGRVATHDDLAAHLKIPQPLLMTLLSNLTDDERDMAPWRRVVAKGGAIGRGPHRDAHFAELVREGVAVSPAGIVQDMARVRIAAAALADMASGAKHREAGLAPDGPAAAASAAPASRSRGMKDRPGGR
ncbi:MAG: MGMT family protein [Hyphomicrobium sp.]